MSMLKTTGPVLPVQTIADIRRIEAEPYDSHVTAHNLYDLFRATAQHCGGAQALTVLRSADPADIGRSLTHHGLLAAVTRAANMFRGLGLAPGRGVAAFLAPTLPQLPELLLGAQVAGVASSINYLLSAGAIADLLRAEGATILLVPSAQADRAIWDKVLGIRAAVPSIRHVLVIGGGTDLPDGFAPLDPLLAQRPDNTLEFDLTAARQDVCALFHTGGTTGRPKLVPLTHGNQIHAAFGFGQVFGYDCGDTVINGFPLFHVGGTMTTGLSVLAAGGHMVVPSPYGLRPLPVIRDYWRLVAALGATVVSGVPTSIASMTAAWDGSHDASTVRMAVTGGAVLPEAVADRFEATTGLRLFETYGMTETAAAIAFNPGRGAPLRGSAGLRAPYSETRIMQIDAPDRLCAQGQSGLVQLRGPQVFAGYQDAAQSRGVLDAQGWLTTGDVGYLTEDERLVLTGREKDLILRSGHNIDPSAIEDVANRHPDVAISAAVGMPDQYAGEVPILFVVPRAGAALGIASLHAMLEADLHEPPARPKRIVLIDALPETAVGKIFKPALRDRAIVEKVRLEAARICGAAVVVDVLVGQDEQRRSRAQVVLTGADAPQRDALAKALSPLPQTYAIICAEPCVRLDVADGIAVITLDRPDSLNAASKALMRSLELRLTQLDAMPDVRAVILTGAGRGFCAGGDLLEFGAALDEGGAALIDTLAYNQRVISMIERIAVPVIGAANGVAIAGGLEMLLCCDMVLAAQSARLGDGHAKFAITPTGGATLRLPERIGLTRAAQLFHTAGTIDAETARDWGMVNEVLPADQLMDRARALAHEIAKRSPEALRRIKRMTAPQADASHRAAVLAAELDQFAAHQDGQDLREGLRAFRQKRAPEYGVAAQDQARGTPQIQP